MITAISARQALLATCYMPTGRSRAYRKREWRELVEAVAAGDQFALRALYDRTHRLVFTLTMRILGNHASAEEVTLDVFHDVWRRASTYDGTGGSVLGWIMNQARSRAIDRLRFEGRKKRTQSADADLQMQPMTTEAAAENLDQAHDSAAGTASSDAG